MINSELHCNQWIVVLSAESLAIVVLNIITIIVFVKQRQLQRKSTYLIIHLAIVDLLAGGISEPLCVEMIGSSCSLKEYDTTNNTWLVTMKRALKFIFPSSSLLNLAVISLERAHATFFPFRHRFISPWVYGVVTSLIWFTPVAVEGGRIFFKQYLNRNLPDLIIYYFSFVFSLLFAICVSYFAIFLKVRCSRHPQHHGAAGLRERKLTSTLFLVTLGSWVTFLPSVIWFSFDIFKYPSSINLSPKGTFQVKMMALMLFFANSLLNPLIYAIRMPELRSGILRIIFRRPPQRLNQVDLSLQNI